jgi:PhnB protein
MSNPSYVQEGFHTLTPYIYGGLKLIDFLKQVFGAEEIRIGKPDESGELHCELKIGDSPLLVGSGYFADSSMAAAIWIYVPDADATYKRALQAGATAVREPANQTWGDRVCGVKDSFGNTWWIATHKVSK